MSIVYFVGADRECWEMSKKEKKGETIDAELSRQLRERVH